MPSYTYKHNQKVAAMMGEGQRSLVVLECLSWLPTSFLPVLFSMIYSAFLSGWIGKVTYIGPAKMVSIHVKHRHDIEIQMIHHFSHGWVTLIC